MTTYAPNYSASTSIKTTGLIREIGTQKKQNRSRKLKGFLKSQYNEHTVLDLHILLCTQKIHSLYKNSFIKTDHKENLNKFQKVVNIEKILWKYINEIRK